MNLFKSSLLNLFLVTSLFIPVSSFAVAQPSTTVAVSKSTIVASVDMTDAKIISQDKNIFRIGFTFSNGEGLQTGVKYGVQLVKDGTAYTIDEKVYDEALTLYENSKTKKEFTYTAPSQLGGVYSLYLVSKNESSLPFGTVSLGKVTLVALTKGISILTDTCYLQVEGEKGSPHYKAMQYIDIGKTESLRLSCSVVNETSATVSVTPSFETRYFSAYGTLAPQMGGDNAPISLLKGQKQVISLLLPKSDKPQFYNLKLTLTNSNLSSNILYTTYIIRGGNATIYKASLDKDYYKSGEHGQLSLIWAASAGKFARSGSISQIAPTASLAATIVNGDGAECIAPIKQPFTTSSSDSLVPFTVTIDCMNPMVSVNLTDEQGAVFDKKDFSFKSNPMASPTKEDQPKAPFIVLTILGLLVITGIGIYLKKKKSSNITTI